MKTTVFWLYEEAGSAPAAADDGYHGDERQPGDDQLRRRLEMVQQLEFGALCLYLSASLISPARHKLLRYPSRTELTNADKYVSNKNLYTINSAEMSNNCNFILFDKMFLQCPSRTEFT